MKKTSEINTANKGSTTFSDLLKESIYLKPQDMNEGRTYMNSGCTKHSSGPSTPLLASTAELVGGQQPSADLHRLVGRENKTDI